MSTVHLHDIQACIVALAHTKALTPVIETHGSSSNKSDIFGIEEEKSSSQSASKERKSHVTSKRKSGRITSRDSHIVEVSSSKNLPIHIIHAPQSSRGRASDSNDHYTLLALFSHIPPVKVLTWCALCSTSKGHAH